MVRWQFLTTSVLGLICLVLSIAAIISGKSNQRLQAEVQTQLTTLNQERDLVRQRVEKMLHQIDELL